MDLNNNFQDRIVYAHSFIEGQKAYKETDMKSRDNPYKKNTVSHLGWHEGWYDGYFEKSPEAYED